MKKIEKLEKLKKKVILKNKLKKKIEKNHSNPQ